MTQPENESRPPFIVTEAAAKRITYLLSDEPAGSHFVIEIQGGGCSGFQYHFDLKVQLPESADLVLTDHGASILIDETSMGLLDGSTLNYTEDLSGAGFTITNPNATMSCGCGNSFSI